MDAIKSKERVQKHGEVFTPDSIVNDMLDMVDKNLDKTDAEKYITTTYMEPACGNGNFILRILDRKLKVVQTLPREYWELGLIKSVASIYGVDIQADNVYETKDRVMELIENGTADLLELKDKEIKPFNFEKYTLTPEVKDIIILILDMNIKHGDCLTGLRHDVLDDDKPYEPMVFTEYIWDKDRLTCKGHTLDDIKDDTDNDLFENNGKQVHYTNIKELNLKYTDEVEDYDF